MVTEIELKTVSYTLGGVERAHLDAGVLELSEIGVRQTETSDLVKEQVYTNSGSRLTYQGTLEFTTNLVVLYDEILNEYVIPRRFDFPENSREGLLAVNEKLGIVVASERHRGNSCDSRRAVRQTLEALG